MLRLPVRVVSFVVGSLLFASGHAIAAPVAYTLDPAHTQTQFTWTHLSYSHPSAGFDDITGTLLWDAADLAKSSVTVTISTGSIHTHVAELDKKLVSNEFFDAAKFPKITFTSTKVLPTRDKNKFKVAGNLAMHGVTRPVVLDVRLNQSGMYPMLNVPAMGFDASTIIKRSEFGLGEGVPMVSDAIQVSISTEALEAKGYAKAMKAMAAQSGKK